MVREGDSLVFSCAFTNTRNFTIEYGVSNAQEMCGPIVLYTPHKRDMVKQISVAPEELANNPLLDLNDGVSAASLQPLGAPALPRFGRRGYVVDEQ